MSKKSMSLRGVVRASVGVTLAVVVACRRDDGAAPHHAGGADAGAAGSLAAQSSGGNGGAGGAPFGSTGAGPEPSEGGTMGPGAGAGAGSENVAGAPFAGSGGTAAGGMHAGGTTGASGETRTNLFFMVDQSYATVQCADGSSTVTNGDARCTSGPNRWSVMSQAVLAFLEDPGTAGLYVALRLFPSDQPVAGCVGYSTTSSTGFGGMAGTSSSGMLNCDADACSAPLIDLGRLTAEAAPSDTQEATLVAAIQAAGPPDLAMPPNPNPQAPTSAAMSGAAQWASAYQAAHPGERTAIVLVTHGEPQGCSTNAADIAQLASDLYSKSAVKTFVVGLSGLNSNFVNQIALAGGTQGALLLSDGNAFTQALLTRLNAM